MCKAVQYLAHDRGVKRRGEDMQSERNSSPTSPGGFGLWRGSPRSWFPFGCRRKKHCGSVLRHSKRSGGLRIRIKFRECGRILAKMIFQGFYPCSIGRMIGEKLGQLFNVCILEVLK